MTMPAGDSGFWLPTWLIESALGAAWTAGLTVAGFVYALSGRVTTLEVEQKTLEKILTERDASTDRRHAENINAAHALQMQIKALTERIDRWVDRSGR